jgi:hypothetical protein
MVPVKMTVIFSNMANIFSIHEEKQCHKTTIFFSKKKIVLSTHGEIKAFLEGKMVIMEGKRPRLMHYLQIKASFQVDPKPIFDLVQSKRPY